mgnify:CR=1 FL=1
MNFSVIIPTYNESNALNFALIELLNSINYLSEVEIILSDGGSQDDSLEQARQFPVNIINSQKGRALQMNTAANQAMGEWLVFLHADTRLPEDWMTLIKQSKTPWGRFDLHLSGRHWMFRVIEKAINFRSRKTKVATGDQVIFFKRDFFTQLGGFPEIPLMEDIAICKAARKLYNPSCIDHPVITSSRRWEKNGIIQTILLMWLLRFAFWVGIKPETLHRVYYP